MGVETAANGHIYTSKMEITTAISSPSILLLSFFCGGWRVHSLRLLLAWSSFASVLFLFRARFILLIFQHEKKKHLVRRSHFRCVYFLGISFAFSYTSLSSSIISPSILKNACPLCQSCKFVRRRSVWEARYPQVGLNRAFSRSQLWVFNLFRFFKTSISKIFCCDRCVVSLSADFRAHRLVRNFSIEVVACSSMCYRFGFYLRFTTSF